MTASMKTKIIFISIVLFAGWFVLHMPAVFYGTQDLPLHMSYVGDEQSPVNGALHILQDKNIFALRDLNTVYYGPIFSVIALPVVTADFIVQFVSGVVSSGEDYKNFILWNWGGIVVFARIIAVVTGFLGLVALFKLLNTKTFNPSRALLLPIVGVSVLATNFFYFEYSSFFKHWIFVCTLLLWQLYYVVKIYEAEENSIRYFVFEAILISVSFGISYLGLMFQVMWLPLLLSWWRRHNFNQLKLFTIFVVVKLLAIVLIVVWHPHAFERLLGLVGGDLSNTDTTLFSSEIQSHGFSFAYYGLILFNNNLSIIIGFTVLAFITRGCCHLFKNTIFWAMFLPLIIYGLIFGMISHHESRYVLPAIIFLITIVFFLAGQIADFLHTRRIFRAGFIGLIIFYSVFNIVHIGKWIEIYAQDPAEKIMLQTVLQKTSEGRGRVLLVQNYIAGYPHTKEAYFKYAQSHDKMRFNLYKALLAAPDPKNITLLNATYMGHQDYIGDPSVAQVYDQVVVKYEPRNERNQFDYIDENITRIWWFDELMPRFVFIK